MKVKFTLTIETTRVGRAVLLETDTQDTIELVIRQGLVGVLDLTHAERRALLAARVVLMEAE